MTNLGMAFVLMRRNGLLAERNFLCCQGCAGSELSQRMDRARTEGVELVGYVFYHQQDNDCRKQGHDFHLGFSNLASAKIACKCLKICGVGYKWSGKESERILVLNGTIEAIAKHEVAKLA